MLCTSLSRPDQTHCEQIDIYPQDTTRAVEIRFMRLPVVHQALISDGVWRVVTVHHYSL